MKYIYKVILSIAVLLSLPAEEVFAQTAAAVDGRINSFAKPAAAAADTSLPFDILYYHLDLNFPLQSQAYSGSVLIRAKSRTDSLTMLPLHAVEMSIDSIFQADSLLHFARNGEDLTVMLAHPAALGDSTEIMIYYHTAADKPYRGWFHYSRSSYSNSEPSDARAWYPCFDQPFDKAYFDITITVPDGYEGVSNGLLESVTVNGDGTTTYAWSGKNPMATYLASVVAGQYTQWSDWYVTPAQDSIEIMYYTYAEDVEKAQFDFANLPAMMQFYSDYIYPYPFEKYGMVAVEPYPIGGMEHQTMTTINRKWISGARASEGGYAHELAHMWFGDLISPLNWENIWLNESFATYFTAMWVEDFYGQDAFSGTMDIYAQSVFNADAQFRYPIYDPPPNYLFGTNVYQKGAWALHMLRHITGDAVFQQIIRTYVGRYKYRVASTQDFIDVVNEVHPEDLTWFFDQWLYELGYPILSIEWNVRNTGVQKEAYGTVTQIQTGTVFFKFPLTLSLYGQGGEVRKDIFVDEETEEFVIPYDLTFDLQGLEPDPDGWLLKRVFDLTDPVDPETCKLWQNFPNPFNSSTMVRFRLSKGSHIDLNVYDITGRLVKNLRKGYLLPGSYVAQWNGANSKNEPAASGMYVLRLVTENFNKSIKVMLLR